MSCAVFIDGRGCTIEQKGTAFEVFLWNDDNIDSGEAGGNILLPEFRIARFAGKR
jgi:hypothetical protein